MNKAEKEVVQSLYDSEEEVLKELKQQYQRSLNDINRKIRILQSDELTQSKIYQLEYQKALKGQVEAILEKLKGDEYSTIRQYLSKSYTDGFVGTVYSMHGQGVPLIMPINQSAAVKAVLTDSKISKGLYAQLGVDTNRLKKTISAEITRGIASGMNYADIARNVNAAAGTGFSNAKRIVRTEGHRIQQAAADDARYEAKAKGADVLKQWDATLDGNTRESHRQVDGEIRELDEKFSNGLMYPGDPAGGAAEVVNCRCVALTRARWNLSQAELDTLKDRAKFFGLDKTENFKEFEEKYLEIAANPKYNTLQKLHYSGNVTPELEDELERSLTRIPGRHRELAESKISKIVITDSKTGSSYSRRNGIIKISQYANADDIIHEYAHALSDAVGAYNDPAFKKILYNGLENISPLDIIIDDTTFTEEIYRVECDKFISIYQGRLYHEVGIFNGKDVSLDGMLDYFSEGYVEYIRNPDNLKKHDPDLFEYIRRIT